MAYDPKTTLAKPAQNTQVSLLGETELDPRLAQVAKAIQIMGGKKKDGTYNLTEESAIAAAMYQLGTGHMVGRDFYMNEKTGRMEGYRGVSRDAVDRGVGEVEIVYDDPTPDEMRKYEIADNDTAVAIEVTQLRAFHVALAAGRQYKPYRTVGIIREDEKFKTEVWSDQQRGYVTLPRDKWTPIKLNGGMTWYEKAKNRAYKNALRHLPGVAVDANDVLLEGAKEIDGFQMPPENARLDRDQAAAWVQKQQYASNMRDPAFAEERVTAAGKFGELNTIRRQYEDWQMATMACPHCGAPEGAHAADHGPSCPFRQLVPPKQVAEPPAEIIEGEYVDDNDLDLGELAQAVAQAQADLAKLDKMRAGFDAYASQSGAPASEPQKKAAYAALASLFNNDRTAMTEFIKWLTGDKENTNDLTGAEASAIIKFVNSQKVDGQYLPCDYAIQIAGLFKTRILGQQALFGEE